MCEETMKKLQAPFKPDEIEWRTGATNADKTQGLALAYVTNRAIQTRLDETFGCFGWQNEYVAWKGSSQLCGISVYDDNRKEWITKWDGADNSDKEGTKGGLSDAMKRAAYQWGIGRYLYNMPSVWMPIKKQGNSYVLVDMPKLPEWALPEGTKPADIEMAQKIFGGGEDFDPECEITPADVPFQNDAPPPKTGTKADVVKSECEKCGAEMNLNQVKISKKNFDGQVLCPMKCQKEGK